MPYAVYAAAKLSRPEYVRPLCEALQPMVGDMDARDINNVVWAAAACRIADLDFGPVLARLQLLLEGAAAARAAAAHGGVEPSADDVWAGGAAAMPHVEFSGWQLAQTAWALPHLKVAGAEDLLRMLVSSVTCAPLRRPMLCGLLGVARSARCCMVTPLTVSPGEYARCGPWGSAGAAACNLAEPAAGHRHRQLCQAPLACEPCRRVLQAAQPHTLQAGPPASLSASSLL